MSVVQLKNGLAGWRKHRPATLPRLPFGNLQPNTVLGDSYIQVNCNAVEMFSFVQSQRLKIVNI